MNNTLSNGTDFMSRMPFVITDVALAFTLVLPGNVYVLWMILSRPRGQLSFEFFYLNLTVSVIVSTLSSAVRLAWLFLAPNYMLALVSTVIFSVFSMFFVPSYQCCICVERYVAVVHPVVFLRYKALRYRVACCCLVWLMACAFGLFTLPDAEKRFHAFIVSIFFPCFIFVSWHRGTGCFPLEPAFKSLFSR